jgi:hypothetical protein
MTMKHHISVAALPLLFVAGLAAQEPASPTSKPAQPTPSPGTTAQQPGTTLTGCLYREDQIPGRTPNVAEKAGMMEDYILAGAVIGSDSKAGATPGATGTSGTAPSAGKMYKVEGPADEKLKALVGKRVEVTGRIDPEGGPGTSNPSGAPTPDKGMGPDKINLPEFEASAIREVSGSCPATPASPK